MNLIANIHAAVWPFYFILMLPYLFEYIVAFISDKIKNKPKLGVFSDKIVLEKNHLRKYIEYIHSKAEQICSAFCYVLCHFFLY